MAWKKTERQGRTGYQSHLPYLHASQAFSILVRETYLRVDSVFEVYDGSYATFSCRKNHALEKLGLLDSDALTILPVLKRRDHFTIVRVTCEKSFVFFESIRIAVPLGAHKQRRGYFLD